MYVEFIVLQASEHFEKLESLVASTIQEIKKKRPTSMLKRYGRVRLERKELEGGLVAYILSGNRLGITYYMADLIEYLLNEKIIPAFYETDRTYLKWNQSFKNFCNHQADIDVWLNNNIREVPLKEFPKLDSILIFRRYPLEKPSDDPKVKLFHSEMEELYNELKQRDVPKTDYNKIEKTIGKLNRSKQKNSKIPSKDREELSRERQCNYLNEGSLVRGKIYVTGGVNNEGRPAMKVGSLELMLSRMNTLGFKENRELDDQKYNYKMVKDIFDRNFIVQKAGTDNLLHDLFKDNDFVSLIDIQKGLMEITDQSSIGLGMAYLYLVMTDGKPLPKQTAKVTVDRYNAMLENFAAFFGMDLKKTFNLDDGVLVIDPITQNYVVGLDASKLNDIKEIKLDGDETVPIRFNPLTGDQLPDEEFTSLDNWYKVNRQSRYNNYLYFDPYNGKARSVEQVISDPYGNHLQSFYELPEIKNKLVHNHELSFFNPYKVKINYNPWTGEALHVDEEGNPTVLAHQCIENYKKRDWQYDPFTGQRRPVEEILEDPCCRAFLYNYTLKNQEEEIKGLSESASL